MTSQKQLNFRCSVVFGILLLLNSEVSCQYQPKRTDPSVNQEQANLIQELAERNLKFSFKVFKQMAENKNMVLSPFCISVALTMTSFGARNYTLKQMNAALDLSGFPDHMLIAKAYNSILKSIDLKGNITLVISNRILIDKSYHIKEAFKDTVQREFRAVAQTVNFLDNGQDFYKEISAGLDQIAKDKFKKLRSIGGGINKMGAVIVSAIYFKGKWAQEFPKENTKLEQFRVSNVCTRTVLMMNTVAQYHYAESAYLGMKVLKMEYSGARMVIYFILPHTLEGLSVMKGRLTTEWFKQCNTHLKLRTVKVKLPKFNANYIKDLSPEMNEIRLHDLVDKIHADLADIAEPQLSGFRLYVQKILYAADVEMGEEGANAVAVPVPNAKATAAAIGQSSSAASIAIEPLPPVEFFADHPFVFIIYDTAINFILFIGNVDCPGYY